VLLKAKPDNLTEYARSFMFNQLSGVNVLEKGCVPWNGRTSSRSLG
jgi:hypothetical protein